MKKLIVMSLIMFAIVGAFAKDKNKNTKEQIVEVTSNDFFIKSGDYGRYYLQHHGALQKDILYKITGVWLDFLKDRDSNVENIYICFNGFYQPWHSITELLTDEEKLKIREIADKDSPNEQYKNYTLYVQPKKNIKNYANLWELKVIKVEQPVITVGQAKEQILNTLRNYYSTYTYYNKYYDNVSGTRIILEKNDLYAYYLIEGGKIGVAAYIGPAAYNLVIPSKIEGVEVGEIGSSFAAYSLSKVKTVTIPASVIEIDKKAFMGIGLEKVVFEPNSKLRKVGMDAFRNNKLTEIPLPTKITIEIGDNAFSGNNMKKISIYKNWDFNQRKYRNKSGEPLGKAEPAIWQSDILEEVVYEEGCEKIAENMFYNCASLKKLYLPSTIRTISTGAFCNCSQLSEIIFAGNIIFEDTYFLSLYYCSCFEGCPLDLKTRSTLMNMGMPSEAFY